MKYRKRPVVISALRWDGANVDEILGLAEGVASLRRGKGLGSKTDLIIETLEGDMRADIGDWIIKGVKGELYPCKPDIFAATYEPASVELAPDSDKGPCSQTESSDNRAAPDATHVLQKWPQWIPVTQALPTEADVEVLYFDAAARIAELEKIANEVPLCADHAASWFTGRHFKPGDCWFCQQDLRIAELEEALREIAGRKYQPCLPITCFEQVKRIARAVLKPSAVEK